MGYLFFGQKETGAERVAMATPLRVSFYFFCDAHLWCQVSRTLLQYFEINVNISKTKKDISKRKMPFFCILKGLSNEQKIFFMSYAL